MAMYEERGFCPSNGFFQEEMRGNTSYFWNKTRELLGDRTGYMVYDDIPKGEEHGYLVDALMHATGTLGIEVAAALKAMMPECKYAKIGRPIILKDIDGAALSWETNPSRVSFEDLRYVIILKDDGKEIHVTTYKK